MLHKTRFHAYGALLSFSLLVSACGSNPEVANGQAPFVPDAGQTMMNGPDSGGPDLNVDSGSSDAATNTDADNSEAGPSCGDGVIDAPENCDDGNGTPGDGCDGNCMNENPTKWDCSTPGQLCTPTTTPAVCGNGIIEGDEACDFGTAKNNGTQGCETDCTASAGWTCPLTGDPCTRDAYCGDGIVQNTLGESCDDGTNDGTKGCSQTCEKLPGYNCPPTGGPCSVAAYCGNGSLDTGEQCDDHNRRSYDGCSATCLTETGFTCPAGGGACVRLCGNSKIDAGETCDDGNFLAGDGCSSTCKLEANYTCSVVGQPCVFSPPPPPAICGNGVIETGELCDDGNANGGDGCSSTCKVVEPGWKCPAVDAPCVATKCGDGILAGTEKCDDGLVDTVHGCTPTCTVAPGATCPANGGLCVPMKCGDGKVTGTETCDDGVNDGKHGCSATCQVISGWECPLAGTPCIAVCGDGKVVGDEQCDETVDVPCCTATCKLKPGFVCDPSKNPHSQAATPYCGNGTVDGPSNATATVRGPEQCDDGNTLPYDGCSPTCTNEPLCGTLNTSLPPAQQTSVPYQCFAQCGDGIILPPEECDDGNTQSGDGCDASCKVEKNPATNQPAWTCTQGAAPTTLAIPVIWRDFSPRTNGQFEVNPIENRRLPGITQNTLTQVNVPGALHPKKYVPAYNTSYTSPTWGGGDTNVANWTMNAPGWVGPCATATCDVTLSSNGAAAYTAPQMSAAFAQWYVDDTSATPVSLTFSSTLPLKTIAGGALQYTCVGGACDNSATFGTTDGFFPLDGKGWVAQNKETSHTSTSALQHNFHFTTEARYWFAFQGGENLAFFGDDDVWVFVNGTLALDIGGIHGQTNGQFTLNANGSATSCAENIPGDGGNTTNCTTVNLGLVKGQVYEVAVFNAERHVSGSNFQLTIKGFNNQPSVCTPICGDGFVAGSEQCDRGAGNVPPAGNTYGQCTTACKLGPYCGDAKLVAPEVCDNGLNIDVYVNKSPAAQMCAPGCKEPDFCGDGIIQKIDGEECDDGTAGNQNTYGHCQTNCHLGARCGDGSITNGEACDDGPNNGAASSACSTTCQKTCGNGKLDPGEDCDPVLSPATCNSSCRFKCGDGQLDSGEQCDDGKNDGSYGSCNPDCTLAPYCGDHTVQNPPEACDNGTAANLPTAYGVGSCNDQCLPGGICGDGLINGPEKCDDGQNTGLPGSCKADCSAYIPTKLCGDGMIQAPEKCDDGKNVNGTAASKCDTSCRFKCGNGTVDTGEQCDNGINDGSYGTCTATCKLAGYCGDGIKNGNEQCDKGAGNVAAATAYGIGVCTKACLAAPFCGDGRVQSIFGEDCEGNDLCSDCQSTVPK